MIFSFANIFSFLLLLILKKVKLECPSGTFGDQCIPCDDETPHCVTCDPTTGECSICADDFKINQDTNVI